MEIRVLDNNNEYVYVFLFDSEKNIYVDELTSNEYTKNQVINIIKNKNIEIYE